MFFDDGGHALGRGLLADAAGRANSRWTVGAIAIVAGSWQPA